MEPSLMERSPLPLTLNPSDPDRALVEASISGDISAFEMLVRKHTRSLLRVAEQVANNLDDAEEAVQEAFLKAYQNLSQFNGHSKFSTWLTRIVLNESFGKLRKRKKISLEEISLDYRDPRTDTSLQIADWHPDPEHLYGQAELRQILRSALLSLRPSLRVVFCLRDIEELSISETATILDLSQGTVKVRLHRARLELREQLSRYFCKGSAGSHRAQDQSRPDSSPRATLGSSRRTA